MYLAKVKWTFILCVKLGFNCELCMHSFSITCRVSMRISNLTSNWLPERGFLIVTFMVLMLKISIKYLEMKPDCVVLLLTVIASFFFSSRQNARFEMTAVVSYQWTWTQLQLTLILLYLIGKSPASNCTL